MLKSPTGEKIAFFQVLEWMHRQGLTFYLTGSQEWGTASEESDWDFFTGYSNDVHDELRALGFVPILNSSYGDPGVVAVLRHEKARVDIQLVRSVPQKLSALRILKRAFPAGFENKDRARNEWRETLLSLKHLFTRK